jgi:hypothetical protein
MAIGRAAIYVTGYETLAIAPTGAVSWRRSNSGPCAHILVAADGTIVTACRHSYDDSYHSDVIGWTPQGDVRFTTRVLGGKPVLAAAGNGAVLVRTSHGLSALRTRPALLLPRGHRARYPTDGRRPDFR